MFENRPLVDLAVGRSSVRQRILALLIDESIRAAPSPRDPAPGGDEPGHGQSRAGQAGRGRADRSRGRREPGLLPRLRIAPSPRCFAPSLWRCRCQLPSPGRLVSRGRPDRTKLRACPLPPTWGPHRLAPPRRPEPAADGGIGRDGGHPSRGSHRRGLAGPRRLPGHAPGHRSPAARDRPPRGRRRGSSVADSVRTVEARVGAGRPRGSRDRGPLRGCDPARVR